MSQSIKDKLKELEKQNKLLTDNLVDTVWIVNAGNLVCEYVTPSVYSISGYTAEELTGKPATDRLLPQSLKKALALLETYLIDYEDGKRPDKQTFEFELAHKKGGSHWVEIRATFIEEAGKPLKIVGVTRDITTRKKFELQLEEKNKKLVEALAEKERLLKENKVLRELLPICSGCKRIRDDDGKWWPLDAYVREHTDSDFSHTICPDCKDVFYPELGKKKL